MGLTSEILKFTFNLLFLQRENGEAAMSNRDTSSTGKLGSTDLEPVGALRQAQGTRLPRGRGGSQPPSCPHMLVRLETTERQAVNFHVHWKTLGTVS